MKSKFAQAPLVLTFEQSFGFFTTIETLHEFIFKNFVKLDLDLDPDLNPDPHSEKLLDPGP